MSEYWLTIVTVCWNSAPTIGRTLDSVSKQDLSGVQYIVVDGGSTDGTVNMVRERRDLSVEIISEPDDGIYDAMNKGVGAAKGEYILLLNSDDELVCKDVLTRLRKALVRDCLNYGGVLIDRRARIIDTCKRRFRRWRMWYRMEIYHPAVIVRRDQYADCGLYDTSLRIAADADMIFRLSARYPLNKIEFPIVRMHSGGISTSAAADGYREFSEVTVRYGFPRVLAWAIYRLKSFMFVR